MDGNIKTSKNALYFVKRIFCSFSQICGKKPLTLYFKRSTTNHRQGGRVYGNQHKSYTTSKGNMSWKKQVNQQSSKHTCAKPTCAFRWICARRFLPLTRPPAQKTKLRQPQRSKNLYKPISNDQKQGTEGFQTPQQRSRYLPTERKNNMQAKPLKLSLKRAGTAIFPAFRSASALPSCGLSA